MQCTLQTPSAFITSRPDPRMFSLVSCAQEAECCQQEMSCAVHPENFDNDDPEPNLCQLSLSPLNSDCRMRSAASRR